MSQVRRLAAVLFAVSVCAPLAAACSSSDTVLALTISPSDKAPAIERVHVTITRQAEGGISVYEDRLQADSPKDDGGPTPSFYRRIVMNGTTGHVYIHAEGLLHSGAVQGQGDVQADLAEGEAVAATIALGAPGEKPPATTVDAGPDASDAGNAAADAIAASDVAADRELGQDATQVADAAPDHVTAVDPTADSSPDVHADVVTDVRGDLTDAAADAPADAHAANARDGGADADASDAHGQ